MSFTSQPVAPMIKSRSTLSGTMASILLISLDLWLSIRMVYALDVRSIKIKANKNTEYWFVHVVFKRNN